MPLGIDIRRLYTFKVCGLRENAEKKRYGRASLCFLHKGITNARLARTGGVQIGLYVFTM